MTPCDIIPRIEKRPGPGRPGDAFILSGRHADGGPACPAPERPKNIRFFVDMISDISTIKMKHPFPRFRRRKGTFSEKSKDIWQIHQKNCKILHIKEKRRWGIDTGCH